MQDHKSPKFLLQQLNIISSSSAKETDLNNKLASSQEEFSMNGGTGDDAIVLRKHSSEKKSDGYFRIEKGSNEIHLKVSTKDSQKLKLGESGSKQPSQKQISEEDPTNLGNLNISHSFKNINLTNY